MTTAHQGMITPTDLATNERDTNWRRQILERDPNGTAPLTAILSMVPSRVVNSNPFYWWEEEFSMQGGAVEDIFVNADMTTSYVYATHLATAGQAGGMVYAQVALTFAEEVHAGHVILLRDTDRFDVDVVGHVINVTLNGANSLLALRLSEVDDNSAVSATYNLASVDYAQIIGDSHEDGGEIPDAISYKPASLSNYLQTFRTPMEISRRQLHHMVRTSNDYQRRKGQALKYHMAEIEFSGIFGRSRSTTGPTSNKELTFMNGIVNQIRDKASANIVDYVSDTTYATAGDAWIISGKDWLDGHLKTVFEFGSDNRIGLAGNSAILGIDQLAQSYGDIKIEPGQTEFGMKVFKWMTPFGDVDLIIHPLFSHRTGNANKILLLDKQNIQFVTFEGGDTQYKKDPNMRALVRGRSGAIAGFYNRDGIKEEWLTDCSFEIHHAKTHMELNGVGQPNTV